ncbi:MAG TPA: DUF3267 domain-containing protein [Bacillales bacterium]|nr:DUF3267 domain-containing protein [Bacillales bacterium]
MNCLKSVRFARDYGSIRITIVSIGAMLAFFTVFYVAYIGLHPNLVVTRFNPPVFTASVLIVYPLHKLFHCLPVWAAGKKACFTVAMNDHRIPMLYCDIRQPISRNLAIACVTFPIAAVTAVTIAVCDWNPFLLPYMALIGAVNVGLSVTDCIYASYLLKAPANTYIEDFRDGFHILIQTMK